MDVVAVGLILTMVGLVALLVWEVAPWQVLRSRGEVAEAPKRLDCGCTTTGAIYTCLYCSDRRCAAHREAIHPCNQGDTGEALCTEPAGTPDDFALWTQEMGADR